MQLKGGPGFILWCRINRVSCEGLEAAHQIDPALLSWGVNYFSAPASVPLVLVDRVALGCPGPSKVSLNRAKRQVFRTGGK